MSKLSLPSLHKSNGSSYIDLVRHTRPGNLVGYWPLNETSGSIAHDLSGNGFHGSIYGCLLGQEGIDQNNTSFFFDGVDDYVDVFSSNLATKLGYGYYCSALFWFKLHPSKYDYTSSYMRSIRFNRGTSDGIVGRRNLAKIITNLMYKNTGMTASFFYDYEVNSNQWLGSLQTCNLKTLRGNTNPPKDSNYTDASAFARDNWQGNITSAKIGTTDPAPAELWHGWLSHIAIWNCTLSPTEFLRLTRYGRYGYD